jgi:HEAT repeat protein
MHDDEFNTLLHRLNHPDWQIAGEAAWALGERGDKRAIDPLIAALDRDLVSGRAQDALVKLGDERALEPLIRQFTLKPQPDLATVLGNWGDRRAVDALLGALEHTNPHVRFYTARALGKLGDERALPALRRAVEQDTEPITDARSIRGKNVAYVAARAIEAINSANARRE